MRAPPGGRCVGPPPAHLCPSGRPATHLEKTTIFFEPSDLKFWLLADNIPHVDILQKYRLQTSSPGRGGPSSPVPPLYGAVTPYSSAALHSRLLLRLNLLGDTSRKLL